MAGIHLEGPYISPKDGPRGAHDKQYVKGPDWREFHEWQEASGGRISIITLSPEWPNSVDFIKNARLKASLYPLGIPQRSLNKFKKRSKQGLGCQLILETERISS